MRFALLCSCISFLPGAISLSVPVTLKPFQDVDVKDYPLDVVVPLPEGNSFTLDRLTFRGVPTQAKAIERWPRDGSLRHVMVSAYDLPHSL